MDASVDPAWLEPTWFLDCDSAEVGDFVDKSLAALGNDATQTDKAVSLFHAVRDGFRYDPYGIVTDPADYKASAVAQSSSNWCTPKSVLLAAAARRAGIPARLGFADVRNHLTTEKLSAKMGTDLFSWHGYSELLLDGRWFKVSSAFNVELCERFGVKVLEFDGTEDALMHAYDQSGQRHMEYVKEHGSFNDLPLEEILADFRETYGSDFMASVSSNPDGDQAFGA